MTNQLTLRSPFWASLLSMKNKLRSKATLFLWSSLLLLHSFKMFTWFRHLDFSSPYPIVNNDYIQYFARVLRAHEFFRRSGTYWGYNPFDGAGVITCFDVGTFFFSYVCHWLSPWFPISNSLFIMELFFFFITPFSVLLVAKKLGGTPAQYWAAFGLSTLLFGLIDPLSSRILSQGLFGYSMGSFSALLFMGFYLIWISHEKVFHWACAVVFGSLTPIFHPSLILCMIPSAVIFFVFPVIQRNNRLVYSWLAMVGIIILVNGFWIKPYFLYSAWLMDTPYFLTNGFKYFLTLIPIHASFYESLKILILVIIIAAFIYGLKNLYSINRSACLVFSATALWLAVLFIFGSSIPFVKSTQPKRALIPFWVCVTTIAPFGLLGKNFVDSRTRKFLIGFFTLSMICFFLSLTDTNPNRIFFRNNLPSAQEELLNRLRKQRHAGGRILVESFNDPAMPYISDLIPMVFRQSIIGGPDTGLFLKTRHLMFSGAYGGGDGQQTYSPLIFGQKLKLLSQKKIENLFDLYNVTRVVAHSETVKAELEKYPGLLRLHSASKNYNIYLVNRPSNWFAKGSGQARIDFNKIILSNVSEGKINLKFHWFEGLATAPALPIRPVYLSDDPVPFISLVVPAGIKDIEIFNAGF